MILNALANTGDIDREKPELLFAALQKLLDTSPDIIFVKDINLVYAAGTQSFADMVGKSSMSEILGRTDYEIFEDKTLPPRYTADDRKLLTGGKDLIDYLEPLTDKDGEARYSTTSKYILTDSSGKAVGLLGISKDVTRQMRANQLYTQAVNYMFTLPEDTYAAIFMDVTYWRIIGQRRQSTFLQRIPMFDSVDHFLHVAQTGVRDNYGEVVELYSNFSLQFLMEMFNQGKTSMEIEYERILPDGDYYWIRDEWKLMIDPHNGNLNLMLLVKDINAQKLEEAKLRQAATTDPLTGLFNRSAVQSSISEYLLKDGAEGTHAFFMIDLDDFKLVNDTYGHQAGDGLLVALARELEHCFRESDIVGRIGGDEFFIFAKNMPDREAVTKRAQRLLEIVRNIYSEQAMTIGSVSIGISTYPTDGKTLDELYAKADAALYHAKDSGKDQVAFASEEPTLWSSNAITRRYESYNSHVMDHSNFISYISDMETYELIHITKAGMALFGLTKPEEYLGKPCYKVIMGLDEPCTFCSNRMLKVGERYRWERYNPNVCKWFDCSSYIIHLNGRAYHLETGQDISGRKGNISLASGELSMEDVLFRCLHTLTQERDRDMALNLFLEAIGGYYQASRAYIFEFDTETDLMDNTYEWCAEGVPPKIDELKRLSPEVFDSWIKKFSENEDSSITALGAAVDPNSKEYRLLEMQGAESRMVIPLMKNDEIIGFIGVDDPKRSQGNLTLLRSVSEFAEVELERRRLIEDLEYMSFTDSLTGLSNRNQYARVLKEYDKNMPESLGIVFADINGLKSINDAHGQNYGDHTLRKVGQILSKHLSGTVFRIGGDEFIAICENISKEEFQKETLAMRDALEFERDCHVAIGCAWRENEENIQNILLQADDLLAVEKQAYYRNVLSDGRPDTGFINFSAEVISEIEDGKFMVYYQPQVDIKTGKIIGAEVLVRKCGDDGSVILPNKFIQFYEMEGVIRHVDLFSLKSACSDLRRWMDQGRQLHLSVNFSRITLMEPGIADTIKNICEQQGVHPSNITIEVTESISKMDLDKLKELIQAINSVGFTVSLDDFGSRYSNLSILAAMDFDEIKFDKSLIDTLEQNSKSRVVMENCIKMCHDLHGTTSLAEGIETLGQLELLASYQCDYGQGYYFSRPVPPNEFQSLLVEQTVG